MQRSIKDLETDIKTAKPQGPNDKFKEVMEISFIIYKKQCSKAFVMLKINLVLFGVKGNPVLSMNIKCSKIVSNLNL